MQNVDFIVIGGGIIGSAIARALVIQKKGTVMVLEKERELGLHASGRNSGVLHSGINQKPGSLKATMCVEGNKRARAFCKDKEHTVLMEECGTIVIARNAREERALQTLLDMGTAVGVEGLRILDRAELQQRESAVSGTRALFSPHGAIVDSTGFLKAVAANAESYGAQFIFHAKVTGVRGTTVESTQGVFQAEHIINCAGLYADRIAHEMGVGKDYTIIPFRGEYMEVQGLPVRSMVYQVPDLKYPFLGMHFTKTMDGSVLAGPTAMLSFGRESYNKQINIPETLQMFLTLNFWRLLVDAEFLKLVFHNAKTSFFTSAFLGEIRTLCPAVQRADITPYRAGIRAQMVNRKGKMVDDMVVEFRKGSTHILNAVSPGMTAALPFADYVVRSMKKT